MPIFSTPLKLIHSTVTSDHGGQPNTPKQILGVNERSNTIPNLSELPDTTIIWVASDMLAAPNNAVEPRLDSGMRPRLDGITQAKLRPDAPAVGERERRGLPGYPHVMTCDETCSFFRTRPAEGLSSEQVLEHRARFGANVLEAKESKSIWALLGEQFEDVLVRILLAAAVISFGLALLDGGEEGNSAFVEPLVILLILIANAVVTIIQEGNAEKSLEALKKLQPGVAHVLRSSHWLTLPAEDLVPGDIVLVRVGDRVPADCRVLAIHSTTLKVEEGALTGEACTVCKTEKTLPLDRTTCAIQDKANMLFMSTAVANGRALAVVVSTGMETEIGVIQRAVTDAQKREESSPLQKKLDEFAGQLTRVIAVICVVVWLINYNHFAIHGSFLRGSVYYFKIAVALAVAAIPEGLPAVITTCLALGTKRMAKRRAIVRRLLSVETLGCTTIICSDKTGTMTTNKMSVVRFMLPRGEKSLSHYQVDGHSFDPIGHITEIEFDGVQWRQLRTLPHIQSAETSLAEFARVCVLCNDAELRNEDGVVTRLGEPTEAALKVLVEKLGCPDTNLNSRALQRKDRPSAEVFCEYWSSDFDRKATLEFSRERKSMSVLVQQRLGGKSQMFIKGAPESILHRCTQYMAPDGSIRPLNVEYRKFILAQVDNELASRALRPLAMAVKKDAGLLAGYTGPQHHLHEQLSNHLEFNRFEQDMIFVGVAGLMDPPRPEVLGSVTECYRAGIRVMMITGDNKMTAEAIARQCGVLGAPGTPDSVYKQLCLNASLTGEEFDALSQEEKIRVLSHPRGAIFSRTEPRHKQQIVRLLRSLGEVVAMTGDGVNDAPAVKEADIGIAMGISGTEVAKEASDMVLADDNFQTIVAAVEEGRSIYNNMKAFIRYLISSNIGEVASIFFTAALGVPEGLAPVQLLWVNLVTDGMPATALGFNPPDVDVMRRPPRRKDDLLITPWVLTRYFIVGLYVGIATVGIFVQYFISNAVDADGHTILSYNQLSHFGECSGWAGFAPRSVYGMSEDPCSYFGAGKIKASTLSLTVLVIIEMLNSLNALSEDHSLLRRPPWSNPSLCLAVLISVVLHCLILYNPTCAGIFGVVPLDWDDWKLVLLWSFPVIIIDEVLKFVARHTLRPQAVVSSILRALVRRNDKDH